MRITLIDYKTVPFTGREGGTCDLCYHTYDGADQRFVVTYSDAPEGKTYTITLWEESWQSLHIDNLPDFAAWLHELECPSGLRLDARGLYQLVIAYLGEETASDMRYCNRARIFCSCTAGFAC